MSRRSPGRVRLLAVAAALVLGVSPAWAGAATDQIRNAVDRVIALLRDPSLKAHPAERQQRVIATIEPSLDVPEIARRALGRHWRERSDAERREFTDLFRRLLEQAYVSKIDAYSGQRIVYERESVQGDYATVSTQIVTGQETEIPVDYLMLRRGTRWLVYDVRIEGVGLVENYRSQFNEIIETSSYRDLVDRIEAKLHDLGLGKQGSTGRA